MRRPDGHQRGRQSLRNVVASLKRSDTGIGLSPPRPSANREPHEHEHEPADHHEAADLGFAA
jgi:hypothetical protein